MNKTHFLKNDDLRSIVEPADPNESAFTATKGCVLLACCALTPVKLSSVPLAALCVGQWTSNLPAACSSALKYLFNPKLRSPCLSSGSCLSLYTVTRPRITLYRSMLLPSNVYAALADCLALDLRCM